MKTIYALAVLVAATAACASSAAVATEQASAPSAAAAVLQSPSFVPVADHHQHLWSPRSAMQGTEALPPVELPAELAALLRRRAELWRDLDALKELYTPDAVAVGLEVPNVVIGGERSARAVGWIGGALYAAYRLTPVAFRSYGEAARITGYYTQGEGESARNVGFFHMDVERGADGAWRIAAEIPAFPRRTPLEPLDAAQLIAYLDEAGIRKAVVLSLAYAFDGLLPAAEGNEYAHVRAENNWVAEQVMRYPDRLVGFCSFNPTRDHALTEIERCAANPAFKGIKLHFGTSPVDLDNPQQVARTRRVFEAANRLRLPIQVHLTASPEWGARQATTFLNELAAAAPDVQVVVAHLWGGARYTDDALAVLADAVASGHPAARNLYFDMAQAAEVVRGNQEALQKIANHMRRIGMSRIYYGSDSPRGAGIPPKQSWAKFYTDVPLTEEEFRALANNVAPWIR
jgi:predicted TIM-barrel fold metal-dependent hydrolase